MSKLAHSNAKSMRKIECKALDKSDTEPDWDGTCEVCGQSPIVPVTGLCGPCTWGEAETVGGNW
jgi:hypothetical protein